MTEEDSEGLAEFELSTSQKITKPLSAVALSTLNRSGSESGYFPEGSNTRESQEVQRKKLTQHFHAAFYDRSRFYLPLFVGILALAAFDSCSGLLGLDLQAYGLVMDGAGAVIIALGLFRGLAGIKRDAPSNDTGAQYGGAIYWNSESLSATMRDTINGVYGTTFLFIGFSIQFIAVSGLGTSIGIC